MSVTNGTRYKTYAVGSSFPPADLNAIQDLFGLATKINDASEAPTAVALGGVPTAAQMASLPTADKVSSVVVPASGLLFVQYGARCDFTATSTNPGLYADLLIGGKRIQVPTTGAGEPYADLTPTTLTPGSAATYTGSVYTSPMAIVNNYPLARAVSGSTGAMSGGLPTSGTPYIQEALAFAQGAGVLQLQVSPGTYDVEVKWVRDSSNASAANVKERHLFVWTAGA